MKISEYIEQLQDIQNKHGDVDVEINRIYECIDLRTSSTFESVDKPFYDEKHNCVIVHKEFVGFD